VLMIFLTGGAVPILIGHRELQPQVHQLARAWRASGSGRRVAVERVGTGARGERGAGAAGGDGGAWARRPAAGERGCGRRGAGGV